MKVLLIHKTKLGGVAIHIKCLRKELEKSGIEVVEITRNEDLGLKSFIRGYQLLKKLFKKWEKEFDVIHAHDWSIAYPAVKSKIRNLVVTLHGLSTNPIAKYFENYIVKKLKQNVIVLSPYMLKYYPQATYIPNGVDLDLFKKLENVEREKNLVGIAQKYNMVKIIKILKKLNMKYLIAKNIPYEKMPSFYSKVSIFVSVPPKTTGFNMVWVEAMACEVPYIIGTNWGIGEILPIYKIRKMDELFVLLKKIRAGDLPELRDLRRWILINNLTWENHAKKLIELYEDV